MDPISIAFGLAQFAPSILKWITGSDKVADASSTVIDIAKKVTGRDTGDEALEAIKADPALVMQFRTAVMAQEADLDKAYLADRQDARARDIKLAEMGRVNRRADYMVLLDVVGLIACLVVLCFFKDRIPGEAVGLISTIAATFGLCLRDAHQFEFGSSRGSREKDAEAAASARTLGTMLAGRRKVEH